MKDQPVLKLPVSTFEKVLDGFTLLFAGGALVLTLIEYAGLPAEIPTHLNFHGQADAYGSKITIFLLPLLSIVIAISLISLSRFPEKFNYPYPISPENAAFEYRKSRFLLRVVNVLTSLLFLLLTWEIIQIASSQVFHLNILFWAVLLAILIAPMAILFLWKKPGK